MTALRAPAAGPADPFADRAPRRTPATGRTLGRATGPTAGAGVVDLVARRARADAAVAAAAAAPVRFVSDELLTLLADPFAGRSPLEDPGVRARWAVH